MTSPALCRLFSVETFAAGWEATDLLDRRETVRILLSITVDRATTCGRAFDYSRVVLGPSEFLVESWGRLVEGDLETAHPSRLDDEGYVPVHPSQAVPPAVPTDPRTLEEWVERALETFLRPGPEVARQLATLLPADKGDIAG